jgi:hypothetical protein
MENKYYTPKIEELYVGFELQHFSHLEGIWKDVVIGSFMLHEILDEELNDCSEHNIRIKYLDREDIESLGYRESNIKPDIFSPKGFYLEEDLTGFLLFLLKNNQVIIYSRDMTRTWLQPPSFNEEFTICFRGILKNKSELKKLMQQLTINKL